jgi:hypothetical protein
MPMKTFQVKVWHQLTEHRIVVRAKSADEAMSQALVILKISFESVNRMTVIPRQCQDD